MNNFYVSSSLTSLEENVMVLNCTLNSTHPFFSFYVSQDKDAALNEL